MEKLETTMYWLNMIEPEEVRAKAIKNHMEHIAELQEEEGFEEEDFYAYSIAEALSGAFFFADTEEEEDYWMQVLEDYDFSDDD